MKVISSEPTDYGMPTFLRNYNLTLSCGHRTLFYTNNPNRKIPKTTQCSICIRAKERVESEKIGETVNV